MSGIPFEQLAILWDDGDRRFRAAPPRERRLMEPIVDAIVLELRRRVGTVFTAEQLGDLYLEGTEWCFDLAIQVLPGVPEAWDMPILTGAAFSRYVRRAMDYGGGRRRLEDES